mgnify:CR=1 FL=1
MTYDSVFEDDYYAKGLAVAEARILTDTKYARFRDEEFEWPSPAIYNLVSYELPFPKHSSEATSSLEEKRKPLRTAHGLLRP